MVCHRVGQYDDLLREVRKMAMSTPDGKLLLVHRMPNTSNPPTVTGSANDCRVVCFGEILWDHFPSGPLLGGAPANVAFHLATLGSAVSLVSRVGDDQFGRDAIAALSAQGVDTANVQIDRDRSTGAIQAHFEGSEVRYTSVEGCAWQYIESSVAALNTCSAASAFYYGTLCQRQQDVRAVLARSLASVPATCMRVCDLNLRPSRVDNDVIRQSLLMADIVKLTDAEADIVRERLGVADVVDWLLGEAGVELVAVTRGPQGAILHSRQATDEHAGYRAEPGGNDAGAGDAFTAVLIHLQLRGADLPTINRTANRYGAFVASQIGATPGVPEAIITEVNRSLPRASHRKRGQHT
jgi:fructokinase